jgi:hypothetical protein
MENESWEKIREFYKEHFNMPPRVVDAIACDEILLLCVSGVSNENVARNLEIDGEYVDCVIKDFLEFGGWEYNLDINPFFIYNSHSQYDDYKSECSIISPVLTEELINKSYGLCRKYDKIRKEIQESYGYNPTS